MMKLFILIAFLCANNLLFGQSFSYAFSGSVKDSAALIQEIDNIDGITKCKLNFKPESNKGEILFTFQKTSLKREEMNPNILPIIKDIFIKEGLDPLELTILSNN